MLELRDYKEASMQLHLASILIELGSVFCILPNEIFEIELESKVDNKNLDIVCKLGDEKAAIELKCLKKESNKASDMDQYDVLKDIMRLDQLVDYSVKVFICLTDNVYYPNFVTKGKAKELLICNGTIHEANKELVGGWVGEWKDKSRDKPIKFSKDIHFEWISESDWHYLNILKLCDCNCCCRNCRR